MTPSSAAPDEGAKAVAGGRFAHRRNPFMVERRRLNREGEEEEEPHFRGVNERPGTEEKRGKRTGVVVLKKILQRRCPDSFCKGRRSWMKAERRRRRKKKKNRLKRRRGRRALGGQRHPGRKPTLSQIS